MGPGREPGWIQKMNKDQSKSISPVRSVVHPNYRPDIDALRAIAVIFVIGFHAFPVLFPGGFIGVDIFFVISGFLISTIISDGLRAGNFSFVDFYIRRIKRIFPDLLVVLLTCLAFGWFALLPSEYAQLGKHTLGAAGFVANILFWRESGYFDVAAETKPLLHLWSMGIEEQFYIIWPLILWAGAKLRISLVLVTLFFCVISFVFSIYEIHHDAVAAFYFPFTRFWELLAGAWLAQWKFRSADALSRFKRMFDIVFNLRYRDVAIKKNDVFYRNCRSIFGVALIVCCGVLLTSTVQFPGWWAFLPIAGTVLIISSGSETWLNRVILSNRLLVWIGLISFPLYLWHWPLLSFARILEGDTPQLFIRGTAVLMAFPLAWLTYLIVEIPIRRAKSDLIAAVSLCFLMIVVGCVGYRIYQKKGLPSRAIALANHDENQTVSAKTNPPTPCTSEDKYALVSRYCSQYRAENSKKTIVLWGDSTAASWRTVFLALANKKNYNVVVISHESCPPLLYQGSRAVDFNNAVQGIDCTYGLIQDQAIALIRDFKPDATVFLASWIWLFPSEAIASDNVLAKKTLSANEERVRATINELEKISQLVVFESWPLLPKTPAYHVSRINFLQRQKEIDSFDARPFTKYNENISAMLKRLSSRETIFFNPLEKICSEKCSPTLNGVKMFQDAYHITPQGSMQYETEIKALFESVDL